jgi:hypothetical protein
VTQIQVYGKGGRCRDWRMFVGVGVKRDCMSSCCVMFGIDSVCIQYGGGE